MKREPYVLLITLALAGCGAATNAEPRAVDATNAEHAAPHASATGKADGAVPAAAPAVERWVMLESSPGATELEAGATAARASEWTKAKAALEPAIEKIRASAPADATMAGEALLGRACIALNDTACAERAFGSILAKWKEGVVPKIQAEGSDTESKPRVQRALMAVGEALFFEAEKKRAATEPIRMPSYAGPSDRDSITRFIKDKVAPWAKTKRAAIDDAEAAYKKISALEPSAPPYWVVHSTARVGTMKGHFVAEFRAAPIPGEWKKDGPVPGDTGLTWEDVRTSYYAAIDAASEPLKLEAKAAFETCQQTSEKFGIADDFSKSCDAWLTKNYPAE